MSLHFQLKVLIWPNGFYTKINNLWRKVQFLIRGHLSLKLRFEGILSLETVLKGCICHKIWKFTMLGTKMCAHYKNLCELCDINVRISVWHTLMTSKMRTGMNNDYYLVTWILGSPLPPHSERLFMIWTSGVFFTCSISSASRMKRSKLYLMPPCKISVSNDAFSFAWHKDICFPKAFDVLWFLAHA